VHSVPKAEVVPFVYFKCKSAFGLILPDQGLEGEAINQFTHLKSLL